MPATEAIPITPHQESATCNESIDDFSHSIDTLSDMAPMEKVHPTNAASPDPMPATEAIPITPHQESATCNESIDDFSHSIDTLSDMAPMEKVHPTNAASPDPVSTY
ncbi:unnamed protein product [Toxocara canis]|uniref:Uncharacterized protein n=1 Tax=Toxocara canis TaxID=6265 RepID=A0A183VGZ9_TOXCA|nr:unnamed protein product [Toxocara canis]